MADNNLKLIEKALEDEVVKGLKVLSPKYKEVIKVLLEDRIDDFCLGEWRSELGRIVYTYRIHPLERAHELEELLETGYKFSKPKLIKIYSRQDLFDYCIKEAA